MTGARTQRPLRRLSWLTSALTSKSVATIATQNDGLARSRSAGPGKYAERKDEMVKATSPRAGNRLSLLTPATAKTRRTACSADYRNV